jgi:hypothetical protein
MLIMSFMLGEAGISCLEMPGEAMNLNRMFCRNLNSTNPVIVFIGFVQVNKRSNNIVNGHHPIFCSYLNPSAARLI